MSNTGNAYLDGAFSQSNPGLWWNAVAIVNRWTGGIGSGIPAHSGVAIYSALYIKVATESPTKEPSKLPTTNPSKPPSVSPTMPSISPTLEPTDSIGAAFDPNAGADDAFIAEIKVNQETFKWGAYIIVGVFIFIVAVATIDAWYIRVNDFFEPSALLVAMLQMVDLGTGIFI